MHHLMRHRILQMALVPQHVRTNHDTVLRIEPAALRRLAPSTPHVVFVDVLPQQIDVVPHEPDHGAVLE